MIDQRITKLAKTLVSWSVDIKADDKVLISSSTEGLPLATEVYKQVLLKKAYPHFKLSTDAIEYFYFKHATKKQLKAKPEIGLFLANWTDKFINIVSYKNDRQLANIDPLKILLKAKATKPVKDIILKKPWVLTYYPTNSMAQTANQSLEELEDFFFKACLQDWSKQETKLKKLKKILDNAAKIKIIGDKTNLSLSFKGRKFKICQGKYNMPDGEIYSCPLETKTNGFIYFDFPSLRLGKEVVGANLVFKNGKVVDFKAEKNQAFLEKSLKTDKGASCLGEFAIGTNYNIKRFMNNTLFDEKIGGTIHLALGEAYPETKTGGGKNQSAIHWDFVKDTRKKGSQVIVNNKTVLKDGKLLV